MTTAKSEIHLIGTPLFLILAFVTVFVSFESIYIFIYVCSFFSCFELNICVHLLVCSVFKIPITFSKEFHFVHVSVHLIWISVHLSVYQLLKLWITFWMRFCSFHLNICSGVCQVVNLRFRFWNEFVFVWSIACFGEGNMFVIVKKKVCEKVPKKVKKSQI